MTPYQAHGQKDDNRSSNTQQIKHKLEAPQYKYTATKGFTNTYPRNILNYFE